MIAFHFPCRRYTPKRNPFFWLQLPNPSSVSGTCQDFGTTDPHLPFFARNPGLYIWVTLSHDMLAAPLPLSLEFMLPLIICPSVLCFSDMPSSFQGRHGKIVYQLEAKVSRSWRWPSTKKAEINFISKSLPYTPQAAMVIKTSIRPHHKWWSNQL